ncbi:hypothetical protein [Caballeronia choica]|uniref:hypothetical protein n=1 Tax=Caballeronia choica TaxID=326476 RepID=UPI001F27B875|nr:hypothetical protein [Caballeronia choica]
MQHIICIQQSKNLSVTDKPKRSLSVSFEHWPPACAAPLSERSATAVADAMLKCLIFTVVSLPANRALEITARRALLPGWIRRPIQSEIKKDRSESWLPPFAEQAMKERVAASAAGCSGVRGEKAEVRAKS